MTSNPCGIVEDVRVRIELFPARAVDNNHLVATWSQTTSEVLSCQSDILFFSNDCHGVLHLALKKGVNFFSIPGILSRFGIWMILRQELSLFVSR